MPTCTTTITITDRPPFHLVVTTIDADGLETTTTRTEFAPHACSRVTCHCHDIMLVPAAHEPAPTPCPALRADLAARTIVPATAPTAADTTRTVQALTQAMTPAVWLQIGQLFAAAKAKAFATFDGTHETACFPFDAIERDGTLVPLCDVIPHAPQLAPPNDPMHELAVLDQYCVRPDCDCTRTVVGVHKIERVDATHAESRSIVDFLVDWQRDHWTLASDGRPFGAAERAIRDGLLAANPGLFATLQRRHTMLRTLYVTSAAAAGRTPPRPDHEVPVTTTTKIHSKRVGRNEPCPCGSGTKYKRCCLSGGGGAE